MALRLGATGTHLLTAALVVVLPSWPAAAQAHPPRDREVDHLTALPPGTTLPVALEHGLRAGRVDPGTVVVAQTTQRVPVGSHRYLRSGVEVRGVVEPSGADASPGTGVLTMRFTRLRLHGKEIVFAADALAIASFVAASDTRLPANGSTDRGNPNPANWTTRQVGGDEVVRSGWSGDVINSTTQKVGFADYDGVYRLAPDTAGGSLPDFATALGIFSASATGLYGYDGRLRLRSGDGVITLSGPQRSVALRRGDQLLLRVIASP